MSRFAGRTVDYLYFSFLVMHLPTTLFVDLQTLYPKHWIEGTVLNQVVQWYIQQTRDPLLDGVFRGNPNWNWIVPFLYLEGVFQAPCFVLGAYGLWKNDRRVYPLLVAYGASTATTLLPVLQALFIGPDPQPPLTSTELGMLLGAYVPFLFIPLTMAVDFSFRIARIIGQADAAKRE